MSEPVRPVKVLVVTKKLDVGGTERHIARILPRLRAAGIDASLFVLSRGGVLEGELEPQGVVIEGPASGTPWWRATLALWRYLRRARPDIVHFFLPEPYLVGSVAASLAGVPVRVMSRRSLGHYQANHPMLARIERLLHRRTNALIANSKAVLDELERESGEPAKLGLIYNGIDVPLRNSTIRANARATLGIAPDALLLVSVANLVAYKGHAEILDALATAKYELPSDWRLFAAGRDDGAGPALARQCRDLGIDENVIWAGERRDIDHVLAAADIFVLASHQEGFSNSVIEAMGFGVPVIATAVGGNLDAVLPEETGLLVPVRDPPALAQAIARLAKARGLRERMGEAGRQRVERLFSMDRIVAQYLNLYRGAGRLGSVPVRSIIDPGAIHP